MKFGIYVEQTTRNAQRSTAFNGTFNFNRDVNNPLETNYAYSNALLGSVQSYTEATNHPAGHSRYFNVEWYAQDTWKVTRRFTLDYGLRMYYIQPSWSADDYLSSWDSESLRPHQAAAAHSALPQRRRRSRRARPRHRPGTLSRRHRPVRLQPAAAVPGHERRLRAPGRTRPAFSSLRASASPTTSSATARPRFAAAPASSTTASTTTRF